MGLSIGEHQAQLRYMTLLERIAVALERIANQLVVALPAIVELPDAADRYVGDYNPATGEVQ